MSWDDARSHEFEKTVLEPLEAAGWTIRLTKWSVGEDGAQSPVAVYELSPG